MEGVQLIEGTYAPLVEMLEVSIFKDYIVPDLSLGLIIGGSGIFATILSIRNKKFSILFSTTSGVIVMFFEFV